MDGRLLLMNFSKTVTLFKADKFAFLQQVFTEDKRKSYYQLNYPY